MSASIFRQLLHDAGFGIPYEHRGGTEGWFETMLLAVERLGRDLCDRMAGEGSSVPDIVLGVRDDPRFNAFAFGEREPYTIAVNYGALILIHDLANRLLCMREVFPWIGNPDLEDAHRVFHPTSTDALTHMRQFVEEPRQVLPRDETRRGAAAILALFALDFLICHEFWHIVGGHLGWLHAHHWSACLAEAAGGTAPEAMERQALEMDADGFAMYDTIGRMTNLSLRARDHGNLFSRVARNPQHVLEISLICGLVMFGSFLGPIDSVGTWRAQTHPPVGIRLGMMMHGAGLALTALGQTELRTETTSNMQWVAKFSRFSLLEVWRKLGNPDRQEDLLLSFGAEGQNHLQEVILTWQRIEPEVRKLSVAKRH